MRYLALGLVLCVACGEDAEDNDPNDTTVAQFGGEGRRYTTVANAAVGLATPRALAFHPQRPTELWIANREIDGITIGFSVGQSGQRFETITDAFGNHFMEEVSSIAFGAGDTFASCQESRNTYDHQAQANDFMGPALWPADLDVFGQVNQNNQLLGSHLDMLHQNPLCMGIAHDHDNVYWVFDGLNGHVAYVDFKEDHGPGYDDHSDGVVRRYTDAEVTRLADVPSHMVLDEATGWLYVADTGAKRIMRLDTRSGSKNRNLALVNEPLAELSEYTGATVETFVGAGLDEPSGIALHDGKLFVSDHGTGDILAFDVTTGALLGSIQTPAQGIMGLTVGPDGKLYYADGAADTVVRVDP